MKPLSSRARLVLDRYKAVESLGSDDKSRLLGVIQQRAARGDLPRFDVETASPVAPHPSLAVRLWAAPLGKVTVALAIAGVPAIVAFGIHKGAGPSSPAPASSVLAPASLAPKEEGIGTSSSLGAPGETTSTDTLPPQVAVAPAPNSRAHGRSERSIDPAAPAINSNEPTIDAEMRLLTAAQTSLRSGDPAEALRLLEEHASRFPASKLADAREVAHMTTLCKLGRAGQARQEADRFLAAHPSSPFAERVRKVCASQVRP